MMTDRKQWGKIRILLSIRNWDRFAKWRRVYRIRRDVVWPFNRQMSVVKFLLHDKQFVFNISLERYTSIRFLSPPLFWKRHRPPKSLPLLGITPNCQHRVSFLSHSDANDLKLLTSFCTIAEDFIFQTVETAANSAWMGSRKLFAVLRITTGKVCAGRGLPNIVCRT